MADFQYPLTTQEYAALLTSIKDLQSALATHLDSRGAGASNLPANAKRWNNANGTFESWESAAWVVKTISIAGGGTGATTAIAARAALGADNASNITSGTLDSARLPTVPVTKGGTGLTTLTTGSFLQGNGTGNVALRTAAQVRTDLALGSAALSSTADFIANAAASVGSAHIADGAVTNSKIADYGIGSTKYANGSIGTAALADNQVTPAKLSTDVLSRLIHVRDEKASGTSGGTFTAGAYYTRALNTTKYNNITGAALASNQITLPAGTYWINAFVPAAQVGAHKAKLRNITDATDTLIGTVGRDTNDPSVDQANNEYSYIQGVFTIAGEKVLEIQHRCMTSRGTFGYGLSSAFGDVEVYTDVLIQKII